MQPLRRVVLSVGHSIEHLSPHVFDSSLRITRVHIRNRSRVMRLVRANSKYKYVICRSKGACVTEHLPWARGPRSYPKEHRLKRRVLWDKEKVWRTGSCRVWWRRVFLVPLVFRGTYDHPRWETPRRTSKIYRSWSRARPSMWPQLRCKLQGPLLCFVFNEFSFRTNAEFSFKFKECYIFYHWFSWMTRMSNGKVLFILI